MPAVAAHTSPQQVIRFTKKHALIIACIAIGVGVVASLLDAGDNIFFFNRVLMYINPNGNAFYQGAVDFIAIVAAGGVYVFVNYAFLRAGGYHRTIDTQQRNPKLHGDDAEIPEEDEVVSFFSNLTSAAGLCSMALMVITNIIGLFILEWPGIYEHGTPHTDRFVVALVVNLIAALFFFAMATLGMILGFHFLEYAGIRARRDERARDSAGKSTSTQQPTQQQPAQQQKQSQLPRPTSGHGAQMIPQQTSASAGRQQAQQVTQRASGGSRPLQQAHAGKLNYADMQTRMMQQSLASRGQVPIPPAQPYAADMDDEDEEDEVPNRMVPRRYHGTQYNR